MLTKLLFLKYSCAFKGKQTRICHLKDGHIFEQMRESKPLNSISSKYCALGNWLMYSSTSFLSSCSSSEGFVNCYKNHIDNNVSCNEHSEQKQSMLSGYGLSVHSKLLQETAFISKSKHFHSCKCPCLS